MTTTAWPELPTLAFTRAWDAPAKSVKPMTSAGTRAISSKQSGFTVYPNGHVGLIREVNGLGRSISHSFPVTR